MKKIIVLLLIVAAVIWLTPIVKNYFKSVEVGIQPLVSASGNMKVTSPDKDELINNPVLIKGEARVFESQFNWRVRDADGTILAAGPAYANAPDVGQFGPFEIKANYAKPKSQTGIVEVFDYSAKDGSEIDLVRIPVRFK